MITSHQKQFLSEVLGDGPISQGKLAYFRARLKNRIHDAVLSQFAASGITKAQLARRLDKKPEQITRWLSSPGNWTLDTWSDLLLGMKSEPSASIKEFEEQTVEQSVVIEVLTAELKIDWSALARAQGQAGGGALAVLDSGSKIYGKSDADNTIGSPSERRGAPQSNLSDQNSAANLQGILQQGQKQGNTYAIARG